MLRFGSASLVLLALGVVTFLVFAKPSETYDPSDAGYNIAFWEEVINRRGAQEAYAEFKVKNAEALLSRQHVSAHAFGEVLFATGGIEAFAACDATFGFGCYHGFFGRAIAEEGETSVKALDNACVKAYGVLGTGCQHGIGHGVLEYVGYENISEALALCKDTSQPAPLLGCTSGVFMEYNSPLVGAGAGLVPAPRVLTSETIYGPCPSVLPEYQTSCYFELGKWLVSQLSLGDERIADACEGLRGETRTHCFLGAGEGIAFFVDNDAAQGRAECANLAKGADELACSAGIAWALFSNGRGKEAAREACIYEDAGATERCKTLADLTGGLDPL
jgi:hypothetical protein